MLIIPFNNSDVEIIGTLDAPITDNDTTLIANIIKLSIFINIKSLKISEILLDFAMSIKLTVTVKYINYHRALNIC